MEAWPFSGLFRVFKVALRPGVSVFGLCNGFYAVPFLSHLLIRAVDSLCLSMVPKDSPSFCWMTCLLFRKVDPRAHLQRSRTNRIFVCRFIFSTWFMYLANLKSLGQASSGPMGDLVLCSSVTGSWRRCFFFLWGHSLFLLRTSADWM